jgi:outer membrane receptor protein involved in Fe transport
VTNTDVRAITLFRFIAGLSVATALCWASPSLGSAATKFPFDVPAGPLIDQLNQLVTLTHVQLLYDDGLLRSSNWRTPGIRGTYSAKEGLTALLRGTGLICERVGGAISIHPARDHLTLQHDLQPPPPAEVVVRTDKPGTYFPDGAQVGSRVITLDQQEIQESGATDLPELLLQIPENGSGGPTEDTHRGVEASRNAGLGSGINLRAAGSRSTLVTLNGIPTAASGSDAGFHDILGIPLAALDTVNILPDGASAVYGTDAVGGVLDLRTRAKYVRPETHVEFGAVTQGHQNEYRLSHLGGFDWGSGNFLAVAELFHRDSLATVQRPQANAILTPSNASAPNTDLLYATTGNLVTTDGTIYPLPEGLSKGRLDFSSLASGAPHLSNPWRGADVLPSQNRWALFTSLHQDIGLSVKLWSDVLLTQRRARQDWGGQEVALGVSDSPLLSHAPTQLTEMYNLLEDLGSQVSFVGVETLHASAGVHFDLPHHWEVVLRAAEAREWERQINTGEADVTRLQNAVDQGTFDPFIARNPRDLTVGLKVDPWYRSLSQFRFAQAVASGSVYGWRVAVGMEFRDQAFRSATSDPTVASDLRRQIFAGFSELHVPVFDSQRFPVPFRNLTLSWTERYEQYRDFGCSVRVPRVGFEWTPIEWFQLHGTWGWSVRAPLLGDLTEQGNTAFVDSAGVMYWSGRNADLQPERARTRTLGLVLASDPSRWHLSAEIGYFGLVYEDRIHPPELEPNILTDPQYAAFVSKHPDRAQLARVCDFATFAQGSHADCLAAQVSSLVDLRLHNADSLRTNGIDLRTKATVDTGRASFGTDLAATYVLRYDEAQSHQAPYLPLLNTESEPLALHLLGTAWWQLRPVKLSVTARFSNAYRNPETQPATRVASLTTLDARIAYTFGETDPMQSHLELAGSCENLRNARPPYSNNVQGEQGFDPENFDLTGRRCKISLDRTW